MTAAAQHTPGQPLVDFSLPLETLKGEPVLHITADVIEYQCARMCVDQAGRVYSGPYFGMLIRNKAAPALTEKFLGELAYQLTQRLVIDMPTARAVVDAALAKAQEAA